MENQHLKHLPAHGQCPQELFVFLTLACTSRARMVNLRLHYCLQCGLVLGSALAARDQLDSAPPKQGGP